MQQLREAFPDGTGCRYVVLDHDAKFGVAVSDFPKAAGLKISAQVQAPWQNGVAELDRKLPPGGSGSCPHIFVPRTKNGRPKRLPLASIAVEELRRLPSYGWDEYVFPAGRPNVRFLESQYIVGKCHGICETASTLRVDAPVKSSRTSAFMTSGTWPRRSSS